MTYDPLAACIIFVMVWGAAVAPVYAWIEHRSNTEARRLVRARGYRAR